MQLMKLTDSYQQLAYDQDGIQRCESANCLSGIRGKSGYMSGRFWLQILCPFPHPEAALGFLQEVHKQQPWERVRSR